MTVQKCLQPVPEMITVALKYILQTISVALKRGRRSGYEYIVSIQRESKITVSELKISTAYNIIYMTVYTAVCVLQLLTQHGCNVQYTSILYLIGILRVALLVTKSIQLLRLNKERRSSGHKKTAWIWVHWSQVTNSIMILTMIDIIVNGGRVIGKGGLVMMFQLS